MSSPPGGQGLERRPSPRPWGGLGLNLGFILLGGAWLAILVSKGEPRVERWVASIALILVGLTGLLGPKRAARKGAAP